MCVCITGNIYVELRLVCKEVEQVFPSNVSSLTKKFVSLFFSYVNNFFPDSSLFFSLQYFLVSFGMEISTAFRFPSSKKWDMFILLFFFHIQSNITFDFIFLSFIAGFEWIRYIFLLMLLIWFRQIDLLSLQRAHMTFRSYIFYFSIQFFIYSYVLSIRFTCCFFSVFLSSK